MNNISMNSSNEHILRLKSKFACVRQDFPVLSKSIHGKPFTYLDSAATAQKPNCVIDALSTFYRQNYGTVHRAIYTTAAEATQSYNRARTIVSQFFNANSEQEIIFTRGTTDGLNIVSQALGLSGILGPNTTILLSEMEHHSNIVPWQMVCAMTGSSIKVIPVLDSGMLDLDAFDSLIKENVAVVSIPHISNVLGTINPIQHIAQQAHAHGALLVVDGAQSAGHMQIDVQALGCDFFVCSGHKMIGPTGIGVLWGKKELLDKLPPPKGGGDMIDVVTFEKTTYAGLPVKFEPGTPMIAEAIGLASALEYLQQIGLNDIYEWEHFLLNKLITGLSQIEGIHLLGPNTNRGALATFIVDGVHPLDLATLLDFHGIAIRSGHLCGQPILRRFGQTAAARASLSFYNNEEDLERFFTALHAVLSKLR